MQPESQIGEERAPVQHVLRFNGHITHLGRSDGLPDVIFAFLIVENFDKNSINKLIENQSKAFIGSQAMYVQRDQGKIIDLHEMPQNRMLVPFHNIAFIDVDVILMTGEVSVSDEQGIERLHDGNEPLKQ